MADVPAQLSPSRIALLLDDLYGYTQQGWQPELRHWQLVDDLVCHPEVYAAVRAFRRIQLD